MLKSVPGLWRLPGMNSRNMRYPFPLRCALAVVLGALGFSFGQTTIAQTATASKPAQQSNNDGKLIFESICAGCHGLDGRGGERGPDIATRQQAVQLSDGKILEILREGRPAAGMPPFASLGGMKLKALLGYLRCLQGKGTKVALRGDPRGGKALFFGSARCSECHMVEGSGGFLGRDLSTYGATLSPAEIRENIVRLPDGANKANRTAVISMRNSSKYTGVIRNEDNFSIQLQSFDGTFHFLRRADVAQLELLPEPIMPTDYGRLLKPSELDDLVSYLVTVARATAKKRVEDKDED